MAKRKVDRHEDIRIYWTKEYGKFRFMLINRKASPEHVNRLAEVIQTEGFDKHYAIKVIEEGDELHIAAGQHRFLASKQIEAEFAYTIVEASEEERAVLREHLTPHKDWNPAAVLNYYVHKGIKEYKMFNEFCATYEFPTETSLKILTGLDLEDGKPLEKNYLGLFRGGALKITKVQLKEAETIADDIADIIAVRDEHNRFSKNAAFIRAVYMLIKHENFSSARLQAALKASPRGFVVQGSWKETLEAFTELYNGTLKHKNKRIDFPKIFEALEKARKRNRYRS